VVLFEPQPQEYFRPEQAPPRLFSLRDKVLALRAIGVDWIWVLRFDQRLASETAEAFVRQRLVQVLRAQHVVVGDDFRFGANRSGDLALLQSLGTELGFQAEGMGSCCVESTRVSSTAIRNLLQASDFAGAEALLGRPYRLAGRVIYGQQLGRTLGFPTANIAIGPYRRAVDGVYRVWARCGDDPTPLPAIAQVGMKPSFAHLGPMLEVHLLDGRPDLYGQVLSVEWIDKVREARKYDSLAALQAAILNDIANARAAFARTENGH
jgi:riboflavin kinase/FMN adenylyltransferase